jgi:hypothetical protein
MEEEARGEGARGVVEPLAVAEAVAQAVSKWTGRVQLTPPQALGVPF